MVVYCVFIAGALAVFANTLWRRWEVLKIGKYEDRFSNFWARITNVLKIAVGQSKILNEFQAGIMHAFIFWGFCVVALNTAMFIGEGFSADLLPKFYHLVGFGPDQILYKLYAISKDIFELVVIIGLLIAFYRRLILRPDRLTFSFEANLILMFIMTLMITDLFMFGIKFNLGVEEGLRNWMPISALAGNLVAGLSEGAQHALYAVNFWVHLVVLFVFMNMLPLGKHFHVITSIPNVYFSSLEPKGRLSKMNLEDENAVSFGVGQVTDLTWKNIFDTYTCTQCGRCQEVCPAYLTKKPLSDKEINADVKHFLLDEADHLIAQKKAAAAAGTGNATPAEAPAEEHTIRPLTGDLISHDTIWACTTCRWCDEACPVTIENVPRIVDMRRYLVLTESNFPKELNAVFKGLENQSNPWSIGSNKRQDWAEGLEGIKWAAETPGFEYLYWVGCAGSFDDRNKKVTMAMLKILDAAGVSYAMLGNEEGCCGDSARRLGNEYLYQALAQANVEYFKNYNVKKIITACPHCFNTFKNEYMQFDGNYEVWHHSEFIDKLISEGKIKPQTEQPGACTYHDSCYLGRYNEIYDQPRNVLKSIPGVELKEMERNRMRAFCCGAGGGRMWLEENIGERINRARTADALATNPKTIATACPFCLIMLDDGIKDKGVEETVKALDIAEMIARSMPDNAPAKPVEEAPQA
jgi:Fe-S oxidoreductase